MEDPSAPKRAAVDRGDDDRGSVRNGIRVDGKRKHQRVREGKSRYRSAGARGFSIWSLAVTIPLTKLNPLAGRCRQGFDLHS